MVFIGQVRDRRTLAVGPEMGGSRLESDLETGFESLKNVRTSSESACAHGGALRGPQITQPSVNY